MVETGAREQSPSIFQYGSNLDGRTVPSLVAILRDSSLPSQLSGVELRPGYMSTDVTMEEAGAKEKLVVVEPGEDSVASLKTESHVTDPVTSWVLDSPTKDMRDVKPSAEVVKELEVQGKEQAALVEGSGDAAILNL
jgi:hypothetical protein